MGWVAVIGIRVVIVVAWALLLTIKLEKMLYSTE